MVKDLEIVSPESEGISSASILRFIDKINEYRINLHSFMLVRHGKILAEGYYKPINKDFKHRIYSSSKSYVSLAVGKLVGEGYVKLTDKIVSYFPEYIEKPLNSWVSDLTIEDCLKMSVPQYADTYWPLDYFKKIYKEKAKDWVWTFFNCPIDNLKPGGTIFQYNTSASFILGVLVEKLTKKTFLEYLRPIFDKIGVSKDIWCVKSPDGYSWGGSGVITTLRDYAKVAELVMYLGNYKGEQLLPLDYMIKATTSQTDLNMANSYMTNKCGYGYQFWITDKGFAMYGMGTQDAFIFPDKDMFFVCHADTQRLDIDDTPGFIYNLLVDNFYEKVQDNSIPITEDYPILLNKLKNLSLSAGYGEKHSPTEKYINGKTYIIDKENQLGFEWVKFSFNGDEGKVKIKMQQGEREFVFGLNKNYDTFFPEKHYYDVQVGKPANRNFRTLNSASWIEKNKLQLRIFILDTNLGNYFLTFGFKGDVVGIYATKKTEFYLDEYKCGFAGGKLKNEE